MASRGRDELEASSRGLCKGSLPTSVFVSCACTVVVLLLRTGGGPKTSSIASWEQRQQQVCQQGGMATQETCNSRDLQSHPVPNS